MVAVDASGVVVALVFSPILPSMSVWLAAVASPKAEESRPSK